MCFHLGQEGLHGIDSLIVIANLMQASFMSA